MNIGCKLFRAACLLIGSLALLSCSTPQTWVQLNLDQLPAGTPAADTIFVAGSFNNWNPAHTSHSMQKSGQGSYHLRLPLSEGSAEFKLTRGSWKTVETDAKGAHVPNRKLDLSKPGTFSLQVQGWQDLLLTADEKPASTAAANVRVLTDSFELPQLGRHRRIWLYLPPDYDTSARHYPVLYMHDGQNLFDSATGFSGEWGVDETLNALTAEGQTDGVIVVGIDHGDDQRIAEYAPWKNKQYGGGEGAAYMAFLVETLKPYIDQHYRTRAEPSFTGLVGSSLGGLISLYGALEYPDVFGRIGIFSPAFWFNPEIFAYTSQKLKPEAGQRFYFIASQRESEEMVPHMRQLWERMQQKGVAAENLHFKASQDGAHSEWYWQREFPQAFLWLMKK